MKLGQLLEVVGPARVTGSLDVDVEAIVSDSRRARPGALFVAIRGGQERDRHAFVGDAVGRGAAAVVVEDEVEAGGATRVIVGDSRRALAALAARFHGYPARDLTCIGITGTNGKSTTATVLRHVVDAAGKPCAYLGTLGFAHGDHSEALGNTTPEAGELQQLLGRARDAGCRAVSMEVSSHGLALGRVEGIDFQVGVFTNLTRDHLDFHATAEDYYQAKALLFRGLRPEAAAVLNADDPASSRLASVTAARVLTYGERGRQVRLCSASFEGRRMRMELDLETGPIALETALTGRFNCSNVMAVVASSVALGIDPDAIRSGVAAVTQVPGRFERIDEGQPFDVIVDYAHTPAGLETVLRAARELARGRLVCVFGCGGDRDPGKRPMMGRVAEELADLVFLTSDNPRSEPPERILEQIAVGMCAPDRARVEPDRRCAIRLALKQAAAGDVVVIAGKGSEPYQILGDGRVPFDDREEARRVLRE